MHAVARVAVVHNLRILAHGVRKQQVHRLILQGIHGAGNDISDPDATFALIGVVRPISVVLTWFAGPVTTNDGVILIGISHHGAIVNTWLVNLDLQRIRIVGLRAVLRLQVSHGINRVPTAGGSDIAGDLVDFVRRRSDEPVTVRVHRVLVNPVLLVTGQRFGVKLAGRDHIILHLTVVLITINAQVAREPVEVLQLLLLGKCRRNCFGVQQADVRNRRRIIRDRLVLVRL